MTARSPDEAAIRAAVQRAVDDPDATPFVEPSRGGKSVLGMDGRLPEPDAPDDADLSPPERATLLVQRLHGVEGLRALATFMHAVGSETLLTYPDPDDPAGEPVWTPCDFVMQHCWALGGTPEPRAGAGEGRDG